MQPIQKDLIIIERLPVHTIIGIYEHEQHQIQSLLITIKLQWDCSQAMKSDNLNDALDYAQVANCITHFAKTHRFNLIEAFAGSLLKYLFQQFSVTWIGLTIMKPQALKPAMACLEINRHKKDLIN